MNRRLQGPRRCLHQAQGRDGRAVRPIDRPGHCAHGLKQSPGPSSRQSRAAGKRHLRNGHGRLHRCGQGAIEGAAGARRALFDAQSCLVPSAAAPTGPVLFFCPTSMAQSDDTPWPDLVQRAGAGSAENALDKSILKARQRYMADRRVSNPKTNWRNVLLQNLRSMRADAWPAGGPASHRERPLRRSGRTAGNETVKGPFTC